MDKRVKKQPAPTTLYLADGSVVSGTIFLAGQSARHSGPETVGELLTDPSPMLRFKLGADRFQLIGKTGIAAARTVSGTRPPGFYANVHATMTMWGGHRFEGQLLVEEGHDRVSDAVNEPWLRVESQGGLVWANRNLILKLETRS